MLSSDELGGGNSPEDQLPHDVLENVQFDDESEIKSHDEKSDESSQRPANSTLNMLTPEERSKAKSHIFDTWMMYYSSPRRLRKLKPRKTKKKLCLIDDIMMHVDIPKNLRAVLLSRFADEFIDACVVELKQQDDAQTYSLVPRAEWMNVVGSTWTFDIKRDNLKKILRFKARLCAQGFTQEKGVDYFRSYSHTIPFDVLRLFIDRCTANDLLAPVYAPALRHGDAAGAV